MLTLYTNPMSRGRIARWALEETGEPYDTVILDYGTTMKAPAYLALNPMGKVPTLVHDGRVVTENAAVVAYLADAFPEAGLIPEDRASYFRWMFFGAGALEYAVTATSMGWDVPADKKGRVGFGCMDDVVAALRGQLERTPYLCGEAFSAADIFTGGQIGWGVRFGLLPDQPVFTDYAARLNARPAAIAASAKDDALAPMPA